MILIFTKKKESNKYKNPKGTMILMFTMKKKSNKDKNPTGILSYKKKRFRIF